MAAFFIAALLVSLCIRIAVFVYRVVRQVHVQVVHVTSSWPLVRFGTESGQAFLMDINSEWVDAID